MRRHPRGFSLIEVLVVVAAIGVIAGITAPLYRRYQIRTDLNLAAEQMTHALARARLLSQAGQDGSEWGFHTPTGTLFKGSTYAARDADIDELYLFSSTISITGLTEVSFSQIEGKPNATGSVVLTALTGEQRSVSIIISNEGVPVVQDDYLTICHQPESVCDTKSIPDNAWPGHQGHGDYLGPCTCDEE